MKWLLCLCALIAGLLIAPQPVQAQTGEFDFAGLAEGMRDTFMGYIAAIMPQILPVFLTMVGISIMILIFKKFTKG